MHETASVVARFDVAQIAIYVFWGFFAGLIWYLRREDHREGFPLVGEYPGQVTMPVPPIPPAKKFLLGDGHVVLAPREEKPEVFAAKQVLPWLGAPFEPTGNPMLDGVGPAAYAQRHDEPEVAYDDGLPKIVPLRDAKEFFLDAADQDPRGYDVLGADDVVAGKIVDVWVDRSEYIIRHLEVETTAEFGARRALLPVQYAKFSRKKRQVTVKAVLARHFAETPALKDPDTISPREEDRIMGYYAGGYMYATPKRAASLI
jgi:photosynthetic reaction center H subunit